MPNAISVHIATSHGVWTQARPNVYVTEASSLHGTQRADPWGRPLPRTMTWANYYDEEGDLEMMSSIVYSPTDQRSELKVYND